MFCAKQKSPCTVLQQIQHVTELVNQNNAFQTGKCRGARLTNFLILLHHLPLLVEGPEPADLLLWLLGQEDVDLLAVFVAQFEGVLHTDVEVIITPVYGVPHIVAIHVDAALIVQDVPAYQILGKKRGGLLMCVCAEA